MDLHLLEVLRRPLITEKVALGQEHGKYAFEVHTGANKKQIKAAVELAFKVNVKSVNVMNVKGKTKRAGTKIFTVKTWKKAIVTIGEGERIEVFEGV